jgi:glycosyltransferase involved in cell wall biosynthesis
MVIEKGIPELLLALKGSTGITLHLIGAALPSDRDSAEPIIDAAAIDPTTGPKLVRHGALTPAGVRTVMSRMHALVLPSHREGLPTSVIEGLASGRPCVVTDVRGSRELVEDGLSGRVVPARDPEALLEAMSSLRELDSAGFARMSAHAVAAASRHRENSVLQRLLSAYSELGVRP